MTNSLRATENSNRGLHHPTNTGIFSTFGLQMVLLLVLYLFVPFEMQATASNSEETSPASCNAQLEQFTAIAETSCGANDGKILTNPYVKKVYLLNKGLRLPYYIQYTYNGSTQKHGPFREDKDHYISGLSPGTYHDLTAIDAWGCRKNHGDVTVTAASCQTAPDPVAPVAPVAPVEPVLPACTLTVDAGTNQSGCAGGVTLTATAANAFSCADICDLSGSTLIANWNFNNCKSFSGDGSNTDFSELTAANTNLSNAAISVKGLYTSGAGKHSCTDGFGSSLAGDAVCVGMPNISSFQNNHPQAIRFDVVIDPSSGAAGITKVEFQELAPANYKWSSEGTSAVSGRNNYPTKYGIRVLKGGQEIYKKTDLNTNQNWNLASFDFAGNAAFQSSQRATYTFELLAYGLVGNGASVAAWDLDDIKVYGGSCTPTTDSSVQYAWTTGETGASISVTQSGTYGVIVTDCNGCIATNQVVVNIEDPQAGTMSAAQMNTMLVDGQANLVATTNGDAVISAGYQQVFVLTRGEDLVIADAGTSPNFNVTAVGKYTIHSLVFNPTTLDLGIIVPGQTTGGDVNGLLVAGGGSICGSLDVAGAMFMVEDPASLVTTIGNLVFNDLNNNGIQEGGELGVAGVDVQLLAAGPDGQFQTGDDVVVAVTTTDAQGLYAFDVQAGTYSIQILQNTLPANFIFAPQDARGNILDDIDSDADASGNIAAFTITAGQANDLSFDAGLFEEVPVAVTIGDLVFNDLNNNGIQETGEPGVAGIGLQLIAAGPDGQFDTGDDVLVSATATDENGIYSFTDVPAGDYFIQVVTNTLPANFIFAPQDAIANAVDDVDSDTDASGKIPVFTVTAGQANDLSFDAGIFEEVPVTVTIGDLVFNDLNKDGLQDANEPGVSGIGVQLLAAGPDGQFQTGDDVVVAAAVTDGAGLYSFTDIAAGDYAIRVLASTLPADFVFTIADAGGDAVDSDVDAAGNVPVFTIVEGQADDLSFDAGIFEEVPVVLPSIGDLVFNDLNKDGLQDANEPGVSGVSVALVAAGPDGTFQTGDDVVVATDITDENGIYGFAEVTPGDYIIQIVASTIPVDFVFTTANTGADDNDSDADALGTIPVFTVTADQADDLSFDAGIFEVVPAKPVFSINDVIVNEEDGVATLEVCLDQVATDFVYARYITMDDSAVAGTDYTNQANYVFIPAGEQCASITINILDDTIEEADELFKVVLSSPFNAEIADGEGTVTIIDTDEPVCTAVAGTMSTTQTEVTLVGGSVTIQATPNGDAVIPAGYQQAYVLTTGDDLVILETGSNPSFEVSAVGKYTIHSLVFDPATLDVGIVVPGQTTGVLVNSLLQEGGGTICGSLDVPGAVIMVVEPVVIPAIIIGDIVVNEEDGTASVPVNLSEPTTQDVVVTYTTADASAVEGTDYTGGTATITIPAGQTSSTITFPILDDATEEPTEAFLINLTAPVNATILDGQGTVTILDADIPTIPLLSINDVIVNEEDGTATLEICLDQVATEFVYVRYVTNNGTALANSDYQTQSNFAFIPVGQQCTTVIIGILDDLIEEADETFTVTLSSPFKAEIADGEGTVTILDQDIAAPIIPAVVINDITVNEEDGIAGLLISLSEATTQDVTVTYTTRDASAQDGVDYDGFTEVVTIPAGEVEAVVLFSILDDDAPEATENFVVTLSAPVNGTIADGEGTVTILDQDIAAPIIPALVISDITVNEEDRTSALTISLLETTTEDVVVTYTTSDASAVDGIDYISTSQVAIIPAGQDQVTVTFPILDDAAPEATENFIVTLSAPINGTIADGEGTVTILDQDVVVPAVAISDVTVNEEDEDSALTISLSEVTTQDVVVTYTTSDASAINGTDYISTSELAIIPAGQDQVTVTFPILDDAAPEATENFVVTLSAPINGTIADGQGTVTILDQDVVVPAVTINDVTVNEEDGTSALTISLSEVTTEDVVVTYTTSDASAISGIDYISTSNIAIIPAGQDQVTVTFPILDDAAPEFTENFIVTLSAPINGTITDSEGTVTILDQDIAAPIIPAIAISDITVNEEDGVSALTISLSEVTTQEVIVIYTTSDASATNGTDYISTSDIAIIPAGQDQVTVTFPILDDAAPEATEDFVVTLSTPINGTIADGEGIVTILDQDIVAPVVQEIVISDVTVNEEDGTAALVISLSGVTTQDVVVTYTTSDASAINGTDYISTSDIAVIPAGQAQVTVTFPILDDAAPEATEDFVVTLSAPINGIIADGEGIVTIIDTDESPCTASAGTMSTTQMEITVANGKAALEASPNGDAVIPAGYQQVFVLTSGEELAILEARNTPYFEVSTLGKYTIHSLVFDPTTLDLGIIVPNQTTGFDVNGLLVQGGGSICASLDVTGAMIMVVPAPVVPAIVVNDVTVNEEDGTAALVITLSEVTTQDVVVTYTTLDASATNGTDYISTSDIAVIPAGQDQVTVIVPILNDDAPEPTEDFVVTLSAPINGTIVDGEGIVTIVDQDVVAPVVPAVAINDVTVKEEDGTAALVITLSEVTTQDVVVTYTTLDASATNGTDYISTSEIAVIPAGQDQVTVIVPILNDDAPEPTEDFVVTLSAPINGTIVDGEGIVTIVDQDVVAPVVPAVAINDVTVNEEDGTAALVITLSEATTQDVVVTYTTLDASATNGTDYISTSNIAIIPAGQTQITVLVPILNDDAPESTEDFVVTLSTPINGTIVDGESIVTIVDQDVAAPVVPAVAINDVTVNEEDGLAALTITLSAVTTEDVVVPYSTSDASATNGTDYISTVEIAVIPAGQNQVTVLVPILNDDAPEATENFVVTLTAPINGTIGDGEAIVTIVDQDSKVAPVIPAITIEDAVVSEDGGIVDVIISLSDATTQDVTVFYETGNQSATDGPDYIGLVASVTIPAGQTNTVISFPIIDDSVNEQDEVFIVNLTNATNATIADAQGVVTIMDNDDPIVIAPILPNLSINDVTVNENEGFATIEICLDAPATETVTVDCVTADGTALVNTDYIQTIDVAMIPVGQTCTQASFKIIDDTTPEPTEQYSILLSNANNANIVDGEGIITIIDNDEAPIAECPDMSIEGGEGTITITGLSAPIEIVQIFSPTWEVVFQCTNNCDAVEVVENLPPGNYYVKINCYNNTWSLLCKEEATVTVVQGSTPGVPTTGCQGNITNGGRIGGQESLCGTYDPSVITTDINPTGGNTAAQIEYLWLASTAGCPRELVDQVIGATGPTYDPGVLTETTYFVRCSRRVGCNVWVESNCVVKEVYCADGETAGETDGGTPPTAESGTGITTPCGDITITYGNGQIEMAGVAGQQYYFKVNAVDQGWAVVHGCSSNCGSTQTATDLADGRYLITIYDAKWAQHCQTEVTLSSAFNAENAAQGRAARTTTATEKAVQTVEKTMAVQPVRMEDTADKSIDFMTVNQAAAVAITLFPNPTVDQLNITLGSLAGQSGQLYLSNQYGQVVKEVTIEQIDAAPVQLQVGQLPSGAYHLTIVANGQLISTEKVMIQQ